MPEINVKKVAEEKPVAAPVRWAPFDMPLFRGSMFRMNPFALMREFTDEMDRYFGGFTAPVMAEEFWAPAVEVKNVNGSFVVKAELPGMKKEEIKVRVTDKTLILEGERKEEKEEKGTEYYRSERNYGRFYRVIPMPEGAVTDKIKAEFADGVLEINMPIAAKKLEGKDVPVEAKAKAAA